MAAHILQVVTEYEERVRRMQHVPRFSYGRGMLCDHDAPNRLFFNYLFCDQAMAMQYKQGENYDFHLAHYMFAVRCKVEGEPSYL
jgi:hypothetical protein